MPAAFKNALGNAALQSSGTTLTFALLVGIAVDDLVVVRWAADNLSATTPTATFSDGSANVYTVQKQTAVNATAAAGVAGGILTCKATVARPGATTVTLTLSGAVTAKAMYVEAFTGADNTLRGAIGSNSGTTTASSTPSGTVAAGDLVLGMVAWESRGTLTGDSDTAGGTWSAITQKPSATSGSDATCVEVGGQYKITTTNAAQFYDVTGAASEWVSALLVMQASPVAAITQAAYQFFDDAGTESGAASLAALNTAVVGNLANGDGFGVLRVRLQSTTAVAGSATDDYQLQMDRNASGTWMNVPNGFVVGFNNPNLTDGAVTTNRLGAGTGTFVAGEISEDGLVDNLAVTANNYTELVYSLQLLSLALVDGDSLTFRVLYNSATTQMTYTVTPTITIKGPVALVGSSGGSSTGTATLGNLVALDASGGGVVYSDNFNRANTASGLGAAWEDGAGWAVTGNVAHRIASGGDFARYTTDLGSPDHWAEIDVSNYDDIGYYLIHARSSGAIGQNIYSVFMHPASTGGLPGSRQLTIGKTVANGYSDVGAYSTPFTVDANFKLRIEVQGTAIRAYYNNTLVHSGTDSSLTTGNQVGINAALAGGVAGAVGFDNFRTGLLPYGAGGGGSSGAATVVSDLTVTAGGGGPGPVALVGSTAGTSTTIAATAVALPLAATVGGLSTDTAAVAVARALAAITSAGTSTVTATTLVNAAVLTATAGGSSTAVATTALITRGLASTVGGTATTTAALSAAIPLAAPASVGTSTVTGTIARSVPLAATAIGVSTTTAVTAVASALIAGAVGTATTTGDLVVAHTLIASVAGVATTSATLVSSGAGGLSALIQGTSTTTAALAVALPLAASAAGASTVTAAVVAARSLVAGVGGTSTTTSALTVAQSTSMASTVGGSSTVVGAMAVARPLLGSSAGVSTTSGSFAGSAALAATAGGVATTTGALARAMPLGASAVGLSSTGAAPLAVARGLTASTAGLSTATATTRVAVVLVGSVNGRSTVTAIPVLAIGMVGVTNGAAALAGALTVLFIVPTYGMWNGQVFEGMQYGDKTVVDYLMIPS